MNRTPNQEEVLNDARQDVEKAIADAKQILEDTETFLSSRDLTRRSSRSDNYEYDSEQYNRTREYMKTLLSTVTDGPTASSSSSGNQNLKVLNQVIAIGLNLMVPNEYTKRMLTSSSLHERYPVDPSVCLDPRYNNQIIPQWLQTLPQELLPPIPPDAHIVDRASANATRRRSLGKTQSPRAHSRTRRKSAPAAPKANAVAHTGPTSETSPPPTPTRVENVSPQPRPRANMDPYTFTNTDDGILNAEYALKSLRAILNFDDSSAATQESSDPDEVLEFNEDKIIALHEQLKGLEDMLRLVTDARLARSLSGQGTIEVDEESMDVLRRVIRIANDIIASETTFGDEETSLRGEPSHRHVQSDASFYSLEGPLSPLTDLSESDSESEPDPECIVCATDLSPPNRVQMPCGHIYCPDCTKELVKIYTSQPFPKGLLRCCPHPKPSISLHHVNRFVTVYLRTELKEKLKEAETPHDQRIYCPQENCKKFINPDRITSIVKRVWIVVPMRMILKQRGFKRSMGGVDVRGVGS
ncbi:hypothetical protein AGABI2DRAFT_121576 [Agaricus bisporus var. bisporus H97]|uniref:hypothetical protein n=1 Tax=Agaricus bisporus var. bisporus (strain H97 / ATCC MYA-4626 / FGSC 10389) TaxID=936046 RepID=UPI00029F6241|nr:hypothetical protein AGABI2DRAFT_121576 [Agaricus bisporus var. bisporus H97]EKV43455.1 hypothetical protein AGABI2DRAFT_121576 [Agaricus bisporus var. bisporus H97]